MLSHLVISIHALLAESDDRVLPDPCGPQNFYPRSPCGERLSFMLYDTSSLIFLSTLSLRRATFSACSGFCRPRYFYPRSPCGERQCDCSFCPTPQVISIHALLAESDFHHSGTFTIISHFYPRSPCGERRTSEKPIPRITNFYPRSPCGERHSPNNQEHTHALFLSTLSLRRATAKVHKTVGHFCAYETNFMEIASSC